MRGKECSKQWSWQRRSAIAAPAAAQTTVGTADIQRLQDDVYQASSDISRLRSSNPADASRLQDDFDTLREEVIYLKVKLRKEGSVSAGVTTPTSAIGSRISGRAPVATARRAGGTTGTGQGRSQGLVRRGASTIPRGHRRPLQDAPRFRRARRSTCGSSRN